MKITLLAVASIDGFITKGNDPDIYSWTSREDQDLFFKEIERAKLIFMGSKTYEHAKHLMKHREGRTRIVITRNPGEYKGEQISNILEFTSETPQEVISRFEKLGIQEALVVGGSEINSLFLKEKLLNEIRLTIEPIIFGSGKKLFSEEIESRLELVSSKKLNEKGTMHLTYLVI